MKMEVKWADGLTFNADAPSGAQYVMDSNGQGGPTPFEALVGSMAACSGMDVVSILQKMRQNIEEYRIEVEWERGPKDVYPRPVTSVHIRHIVKGQGLDPQAVEKAVRLSDEKYCGVTATLRTPPPIKTTWETLG